ncbi:MAG: DNA polymerase III subunit delta [Ignavibacteria bacterium]
MKKKNSTEQISLTEFKKRVNKGIESRTILLFTNEKIVLDEILLTLGQNFIEQNFDPKKIRFYYSDNNELLSLLNECSNISFFTDKNIYVYKIIKSTGIKGLRKDDKELLLKYLMNPNPNSFLILYVGDDEFNLNNFDFLEDTRCDIVVISPATEETLIEWALEKFEDYKISREVISFLLKFINISYDELFTEIEKLKRFCYTKKEITTEDVVQCVGLSKEFNENEFISAVLNKEKSKAIMIYDSLTLKADKDLFLLYLLKNAYIGILKLFDRSTTSMSNNELLKVLRIWDSDYQARISRLNLFKKIRASTNEIKIKKAINYIYETDKKLKTSDPDSRALFVTLVKNLSDINLGT